MATREQSPVRSSASGGPGGLLAVDSAILPRCCLRAKQAVCAEAGLLPVSYREALRSPFGRFLKSVCARAPSQHARRTRPVPGTRSLIASRTTVPDCVLAGSLRTRNRRTTPRAARATSRLVNGLFRRCAAGWHRLPLLRRRLPARSVLAFSSPSERSFRIQIE